VTATGPTPPHRYFDRSLLAAAAGAGFLYGLVVRAFFGFNVGKPIFQVMSLAFLFGVPFVVGFLVVAIAERRRPIPWTLWLVLPWLPALLSLGAALTLGWEGLICIFLWIPLFLFLSTLGGLVAGIWRRLQRRRLGGRTIAAALLLPLAAAPLERLAPTPLEVRTVDTVIEIAADPGTVWREIVDVPLIRAEEHRRAWTHAIGFPRPIAASSVDRGVGAVRHATFERGVLFVETITVWEPERALAFAIRADPIPPGTLDEHVTVGGPYFDVLEGRYRIEPVGPGRVRLHLASRHRLSTHFNLYSGLWTDAILRETQAYILDVIRRRAETAPVPPG
jgi:hypothetical protein